MGLIVNIFSGCFPPGGCAYAVGVFEFILNVWAPLIAMTPDKTNAKRTQRAMPSSDMEK